MNSVAKAQPSPSPTRRAVLALGACAVGAACSGEQNQPRRVQLGVRIEAADGAAEPFPLLNGYTGRIERALMAIDALYFFSGAPAVTARAHGIRRRVRSWFSIPSAHAHPGHYASGEAVGQLLHPTVVNVLSTASVASANGVTGEYRSLSILFARAPQGPLSSELGGSCALLEGTATLGERVIDFRFGARFEDLSLSLNEGVLDGCQFEEHSVGADGVVTVRVDPRVWLTLADFSELAPEETGPVEIASGQRLHTAFVRGLAQARAYRAAFTELRA